MSDGVLYCAPGQTYPVGKLLMALRDGLAATNAKDCEIDQVGRRASVMADEIAHERVQHVRVNPDFTFHAIAMSARLRGGNWN